MKNYQSLIIGKGQIGNALFQVLDPYYEVCLRGKHTEKIKGIDVMHICFPYSKQFIKEVKRYQKLHKPRITVIHSTVPVGTSGKLNACHSPVRGMHPYLAKSIKIFAKFVGGKYADEVAEYFRRVGIKPIICRKSETTELGKILSTTAYGLNIEFAKQAEKACEKLSVPFSETYTLFTQTYNEGWQKMGHSEYTRPVLQPIQKRISGHCVLQNCGLLKNEFTEFIKGLN